MCTLHGLPVAFALAGAKADEREVLRGMFTAGPDLVSARPVQTLIGDKNYYGTVFEAAMAGAGIRLLRPARKGEPARAGAHLFKPLRQIIESVNVLQGSPACRMTWHRKLHGELLQHTSRRVVLVVAAGLTLVVSGRGVWCNTCGVTTQC